MVEETGVPGENHRPATSHRRTSSHNVVSITPHLNGIHRICGVMVSILAVDHGFEPDRVKPKTIKLVLVASPLGTQH